MRGIPKVMIRVERKRSKGWRMPRNTIYVGRPTKWGNPFPLSQYTREESLSKYEAWVLKQLDKDPHFLDDLQGKNLA